jgi:patatin-related protein
MGMQPGRGGLLGHDLSGVPPEEVRFGVVLNGGVSLAVWMGGVALELDRLVKAPARHDEPYAALLRLAGCSARVDVISGTSAGGVNGAALALAQVNRRADIAALRDVWVEQGRIEALLRQPFRGAPSSLLKGDEHFLPQLNAALTGLAVPTDTVPAREAPIDLTMMTTVLHGNQEVTVDALGQRLPQSVHGARFHWKRPVDVADADDPFGLARIRDTAAQLALAARGSSSFPMAFEPAFVPVSPLVDAVPGTPPQTSDLRPDMQDVVEDWGDVFPARNRSRFVVDGGVLANTPTRAAVEAIERMPADGPVRRVMLLVYPHAPEPGPDPADALADAPTLTGALTGVLGALSAQGSRTFVDELEDHNIRAASRRGTRADLLGGFDEPMQTGEVQRLEQLGGQLFPHYRRLRIWHASRDLARRQVRQRPPESWPEQGEVWDYERIRRAAERAQQDVENARRGIQGDDPPPIASIPYVPDRYPTLADPDADDLWRWGVTGAISVAEAANELLRDLVWVLPAGDDWDVARKVREQVTEQIRRIRESRALTDGPWETDEVLTALRPDHHYWMLRLASYARLMTGTGDDPVRRAIADVVRSENERRFMVGNDKGAADAWSRTVAEALERRLVDDPGATAGSAGAAVRHQVERVVEVLQGALPVLQRYCDAHPVGGTGPQAAVGDVGSLHRWRVALCPGDVVVGQTELLTTLLQLEVASTTIGDEATTGSTIPIDVVQLSAQTDNAFARYSRTGDDKLGGWSVKRFGGFLKRSWRVNDWTWGRLDAATVLCRTILHPARVRRAAQLSGYLDTDPDPRALAEATVDDLVSTLFGGTGLEADPRVEALRVDACAELTGAFTRSTPTTQLPAMMPALAHLFAWAIQLDVVPAEVGRLAAAIREDHTDGANPRSRGELFLAAEGPLLARVETARHDGAPVSGTDRAALLAAFDRAGVGREPLADETSSDLMIRSATTAGAVGATVLDSPASGLAAVRPVTRLVRGAMLVLHWTIVGLTSRGVVPRMLALLGLSIGGILLIASLFGALPDSWAGPAAMIGWSCLLAAFAFGALRTGTLLHGLVLLSPIVPLLTFAFTGAGRSDQSTSTTSALQGGLTLVAMVGVAVALLVLGSLPAAYGSVWLALGSLADRRGVVHQDTRGRGRLTRLTVGTSRRAQGLLRSLPEVVKPLVVVALPALLAWWIVRVGVSTVAVWIVEQRVWLLAGAVACLVVGAVAALYLGDLLRPVTRVRREGVSELEWDYGPLVASAGVNASWSWLYGAGYFVVAFAVTWLGLEAASPAWVVALVVTALVLGVALTLGMPLVAPPLAIRGLERREHERDAGRPRFVVLDALPVPVAVPVPDGASGADAGARAGGAGAVGAGDGARVVGAEQLAAWTARRSYAVDLAERGVGFRWLVSIRPGRDDLAPSLTGRGVELLRRLDEAREVPPPSGWRWRWRRTFWWGRYARHPRTRP